MAYVDSNLNDPSLFFNTVIFTGDVVDGDGTYHDQAVTGVGFEPDLLWHKGVTGARPHYIVDSVRGQGGSPTEMKHLSSSATAAETTTNTNGHIKSLDSDGWTAVSGSDSSSRANNSCLNGEKYVGWCWKESADSGMDIVTYTGNSTGRDISHSLSALPKTIFVKARSEAEHWAVYHAGTAASKQLYLNLNNAEETSQFGSDPTTSVFSLGTNIMVNGNTETYVAYLFSEKQGYSKFGSFTSNGQVDGNFVWTGFRPALVIIKRNAARDWVMHDNKRDGYNGSNENLHPNLNNAEGSGENFIDLLSNGFKIRSDDGTVASGGDRMVYWSWAEAPFVNSKGVPCNAR